MLLAAVSFAAATAPARAPAVTHSQAVPILLYHAIGPTPASAPYPALYVGGAAFRTQMGWLAQHGWHPVTMDALLRSWRGGRSLPRKPVVLSFDDGYPGDWQVALPDLRERGWPGVLNLHIGNLVPARVRSLIRAGWEVDAHTFTHPDLTTVGATRLEHEVAGSRTWIRHVFGVPVDVFCYPAGRYNATVIAAVRAAGYLAAVTENPGWASPAAGLFTLPRVRVNGGESIGAFAASLHSSG
jgi:peptidoglycan/xylan/chitin deacetylase (PgdA/CDA1 family)